MVRKYVRSRREVSGTIDFSSAGEGKLDKGRRVARAHGQTIQVLGLSLEFLVAATQASKVDGLRLGAGSFCEGG